MEWRLIVGFLHNHKFANFAPPLLVILGALLDKLAADVEARLKVFVERFVH